MIDTLPKKQTMHFYIPYRKTEIIGGKEYGEKIEFDLGHI
jgi:hypothetical protein